MSSQLFGSLLASTQTAFPALTSAVLVPVAGALLIALFVPRSRPDLLRQVAVLSSSITAMITVYVLVQFEVGEGGFQLVTKHTWVEEFGISWHLGVDGISLFLVVLSGMMFPLVIAALDPGHDPKAYFAWLLALQSASIGVFVALDLFMFFVFFELVLVPMYFLIGGWGHENRVYAALKFFLYTMIGSALMLVGILALVFLNAGGDIGAITFDLVELAENPNIATETARWIFLSFALAFAIKVPLVPFHTWLPDAHTEAPTAGSVILAAVMLKLGTYGFLRFGLYLFPEAARWAAPAMLTLAVIGIVYGAVVATMQRDLKRLVAYSSVAHLGFIILGTFALNLQGIDGGILQMVNHGISTGALFMLVGMIYERRHTRQISELSGLQKSAPLLAGAFTVVMFSSVGLPGLNGFVGEFLILLGAFESARWWAVVAATGVILAALYLLWAYQRVFHGEPKGDNADMSDLTLREGLSLAPLIVLIVFLGVYPKPMLDRIEPSVERLIDHMGTIDEGFTASNPPAAPARTVADLESESGEDEGDHGDENDHGDQSEDGE